MMRLSAAGVLLASAVVSAAAAGLPTVQTTAGKVSGLTVDGIDGYLGIPFAAPPTGALRFMPPGAHPGWPSVRSAVTAGAKCVQGSGPAPDKGHPCPAGWCASPMPGPTVPASQRGRHFNGHGESECQHFNSARVPERLRCAAHGDKPDECGCGVCGSFGGCSFSCTAGAGRVKCPNSTVPGPPPPAPRPSPEDCLTLNAFAPAATAGQRPGACRDWWYCHAAAPTS